MGLGLFGVPWVIRSMDPAAIFMIKPSQPPVNGADISGEARVVTIESVGAVPTVQWLGPGVRSIKIEGLLYAKTILTDLRPERELLASLVAIHPNLGRAPRVSLDWGDDFVIGFVSAVPQKIVGHWATGQPREVQFSIEVLEAPETSIEGVGASAGGAGETLRITLGEGESFEALAQRYLGDPMRGDLIRGINPGTARDREAAGMRVKVFERDHPAMRRPVSPGAPCFAALRDGSRPWEGVIADLGQGRGDGRGLPARLLRELAA